MDAVATQEKPKNDIHIASSKPSDERLLIKWLESLPQARQREFSQESLDELLDKAAQPRHASGNACIKLCYFIEQCRGSKSLQLRELIFSRSTCLALFSFYLEWNEKNQNRSMRQVLELLSSNISLSPDKSLSASIKDAILQKVLSVLGHQAAQPLVKPAFKLLDCFIGKGSISTQELVRVYANERAKRASKDANLDTLVLWDSLIASVFDWMSVSDVSPAAGKCLVSIFGQLRKQPVDHLTSLGDHAHLWQRWIRKGLSINPESLDNVKVYLFIPLFKLDRAGSIAFLKDLNQQKLMSDTAGQDLDAHSLLQLAAMDVGKKAGLVEESSSINFQTVSKKATGAIVLQEDVVGPLLAHATATVRSLAFSVLVSSSSTIRPFSVTALDNLQAGMGVLHADTDAKFRNDVLSNTKHMIERMRGACSYLTREAETLSYTDGISSASNTEQLDAINALVRRHDSFMNWYLEFLLDELIPTSSYQRHITALKSLAVVLRSGILGQSTLSAAQTPDHNTIWPKTTKFFTTGAMRLLLDLLLDPFEDVRSNAAAILKFASLSDFENEKVVGFLGASEAKIINLPLGNSKPDDSIPSTPSTRIERPQTELTSFIKRASQIAKRTGRADIADGVARSYELLYSLQPTVADRLTLVGDIIDDLALKVATAEQDLSKAVSAAPVHGNFAALSLIWESINNSKDWKDVETEMVPIYEKQWDAHHQNVYLLCTRVWTAVKDVLCNDSPEGHLLEDAEELDSIDTKDILSYSFRAVHESSNLMRNMASKLVQGRDGQAPLIPINVFVGIGNLAFEQLSTLRHRGAFSTVSSTFARCCQLAQGQVFMNGATGQNPIEQWYQGALGCIFQQKSTTRRSAGIPALMTGIMSSNAQIPAFDDVMADLKSISRIPVKLSTTDQTKLPQVHAINCLKEVFKSATLGKRSDGHLAECLELAVDGLNSDIWAIRNCALLLLRSLIDCLFGTSESKLIQEAGWDGKSIRLSYDKHPTLPLLLLKLLDIDTNVSAISEAPVIGVVESVFPALDIIRRAGPPPANRAEVYRCVSMHLGSKLWHVREIAARTICTMLFHENWLDAILELVKMSESSINHLHGVLMAVKFTLERRLISNTASSIDGLSDIVTALKIPKSGLFFESGSPEILAGYLELSNTIGRIILSAREYNLANSVAELQSILFPGAPFEDFTSLTETYLQKTQSTGGYNSDLYATLGNAIARRAIYASAMEDNPTALQNILTVVAALNTDIALSALGCIPQAWQYNDSRAARIGIPKAYLGLLKATISPELRSVALCALAEALERQFTYVVDPRSDENCLQVDRSFEFDTESLRSVLECQRDSPSLSNARIRVSGCILISECVSQRGIDFHMRRYRSHLETWGHILCTAGHSRNDFETRMAAAKAMASLYGNQHFGAAVIGDECALQSLFALYDSLNDDDDEIRDLSARSASSLLQKSLLPLAASKELASYIQHHYGLNPLYASNVVCRMTGNDVFHAFSFDPTHLSLNPAASQFSKALQPDDSLFVEEEQNLFIDEVREVNLWASIFTSTPLADRTVPEIKTVWRRAHSVLAHWVLNGLEELNHLLANEDGPLGWTSKPAAFELCMRIVVSANAILQRHEGLLHSTSGGMEIEDIREALKEFGRIGRDKRCHESLLFEVKEELLGGGEE